MTIARRHILGWAIGLTAIETEQRRDEMPTNSGEGSEMRIRVADAEITRSPAARASDEINILDFGAPADGKNDDYPAFIAARDSRPPNSVVRIRMPARDYNLSRTPDENQRRVVVLVDEGATFAGDYRPYGSRVVMGGGSQHNEFLSGRADEHELVGNAVAVHNNGPQSGYGYRFEYISEAISGGGGDIAQASICQWNKLDHGGAAFGNWNIYATPEEALDGRWMLVGAEFNVVNRGADQGWASRRGAQPTMAGIHAYGPMQESYAGPIGRNILFAHCYFGMPKARTYNIHLVEQDAIAPTGYYAYVQGSTEIDQSRWPAAAMAITDGWIDGFRADKANIQSGAAYSLGIGQYVAYRDAQGIVIACDMAGPEDPEGTVAAPPGSTWRRTDSQPGRRFYVMENGYEKTGWIAR